MYKDEISQEILCEWKQMIEYKKNDAIHSMYEYSYGQST